MNLFLRRIFIFLLPILLLAIGLEILLRKIPNDYSYKSRYLDAHSRELNVLILGNSHTYFGINPEFIRKKSFNAAHNSQSLNFDLEILKKYENRWDSLKFIIIPIDYLSLYYSIESGIESWRLKYYSLYYNIHSSNELKNNTELLSSKLKINLNRLYRFYLLNDSSFFWSELGWGNRYHSGNCEDLITSGEKAAMRHKGKNEELYNFNIEILNRIVAFARAKNIIVLLVDSPAYKSYVDNLDEIQLNKTVIVARELTSSYTHVKYFNMLTDKSFVKADFCDGDHLNEVGAKKLTLKIDSVMSALMVAR